MKKNIKILLIVAFFFLLPFSVDAKEVTLNLFYGKECPHCEKEQQYLETLKEEYGEELKINKFEVWHNDENRELLEKVKKELNYNENGVPFTVVGKKAVLGYNEAIASDIKDLVDTGLKNNYIDAVSYIKDGKKLPAEKKVKEKTKTTKTIPILGKVDLTKVSLPLLSAVLGLADGFNPCAMWVLLFLIAMLIQIKDKKRMLILGITFLGISAIMYTTIMASWLLLASGAKNILTDITSVNMTGVTILKLIIALVALIVGIINLRSYIKTKNTPDGCEVVDDQKRTKILEKIKNITKEKKLLLAVLGISALAISVNLVELACSAGIPLVYSSALVLNDLNILQYILYIFIYIVFFMLDDFIVFFIAYKTNEITGISTKYSKYAHLVGGIVMIIIALFLIMQSGLF